MMKDTCNKFIEGINSAIDNDTSRRITSLRFLLIVLVVFIHNCYTLQSIQNITDSGGTAPIFVENAFGTWIKLFITSGIARSAVPIFFMFSAYLQAKKNDTYLVLLKKKSKSLLLPYILWMFIYGFYYAGLKLIIVKIAPLFLNNPESTCLEWTFVDWIYKIFGYKSKIDGSGFELPGFAYQFWFIRDLLILSIISPLFKYFIKKIPIAFLLFVLTAYIVPIRFYFVENESFFLHYWIILGDL